MAEINEGHNKSLEASGPDADDTSFLSKLVEFPCLFFMKDLAKLGSTRLKDILNMLQDHAERDNQQQEHADSNENLGDGFEALVPASASLMVLVLWLLHREDDAKDAAEHALRAHPTSIIARTNMAYILFKRGEKEAASKILKELMDLREENSTEFDDFIITAQAHIAYGYTKLGYAFTQHAINEYDDVIKKKPEDHVWKFSLGLNLRRSTHEANLSLHPDVDCTQALLKAFSLLVEVKDNTKNNANLRALAAAELGQILNFLEKNETGKALSQSAERLRLSAYSCFDEAVKLNESNASVLRRAGTFFRYNGQLERSCALLRKAVEQKPTSDNHHHLGITYKKIAMQAKQKYSRDGGDQTRSVYYQSGQQTQGRERYDRDLNRYREWPPNDRGSRGGYHDRSSYNHQRNSNGRQYKFDMQTAIEKMIKSPYNEKFSQDDYYVREAIVQFEEAAKLSHGNNTGAVYDLGLMHKALGDYIQALVNFQKMLDLDNNPMDCIKALEQSGLVCLEMSVAETQEEKARDLQELGFSLLRMALNCQCRLIEKQRRFRHHNSELWKSFYTLAGSVHQKSRDKFSRAELQEEWLLKLLKRYADNLQVLQEIFSYTLDDARDVRFLEARIKGYAYSGRSEDGVVFLCLLKLTEQWKKTCDLDLQFKVLIHAARDRLMRAASSGNDFKSSFNKSIAKMIFRWAFENKHDKQESQTTKSMVMAASPDNENDIVTDGCHVMLLHDMSDKTAGNCVVSIERLGQEIFGLRVTRLSEHTPEDDERVGMEMSNSRLLFAVYTGQEVSPQFDKCIKNLVKYTKGEGAGKEGITTPVVALCKYHLVTLVVDGATLPASLQEFPSMTYQSQHLLELSPDTVTSKERVNAVCELFCFLLGVMIKFA